MCTLVIIYLCFPSQMQKVLRGFYSVSEQEIVHFTALAVSPVEVMAFSISSGTMFVSRRVIPEGCCGCGQVSNPPEI